MRYRLSVLLLLLLTLCAAKYTAAWADGRKEAVIQCEIYEDTCAQLLSCGDRYRIKLFHYREGRWNEAAETGPIPCRGLLPRISLESDLFYIHYTEQEYVVYKRNRDHLWRLSLFYHSSSDGAALCISFYEKGIFVADFSTPLGQAFWLFGEPVLSTRVEDFHPALFPRSIPMTSRLVDTSGWGCVDCPEAQALCLYERPDFRSPVLGKVFHGAPIRIVRRESDWVYVRVAELFGWLPADGVQTGEHMMEINSDIMDWLHLMDTGEKVPVYPLPSTNSNILCDLGEEVLLDPIIIFGSIAEEWYMLWNPNGPEGFIQARWVTPGNG